ncbi:MAG: hypothetical protein Greene041619_983 [Candidatus Peregrinibacteria bacterium Greene0416_19]|nr:MAG: hypothetical protein Greene041619_983 [Candidatus Peregrinibacteria bacterium Greene0416_19]
MDKHSRQHALTAGIVSVLVSGIVSTAAYTFAQDPAQAPTPAPTPAAQPAPAPAPAEQPAPPPSMGTPPTGGSYQPSGGGGDHSYTPPQGGSFGGAPPGGTWTPQMHEGAPPQGGYQPSQADMDRYRQDSERSRWDGSGGGSMNYDRMQGGQNMDGQGMWNQSGPGNSTFGRDMGGSQGGSMNYGRMGGPNMGGQEGSYGRGFNMGGYNSGSRGEGGRAGGGGDDGGGGSQGGPSDGEMQEMRGRFMQEAKGMKDEIMGQMLKGMSGGRPEFRGPMGNSRGMGGVQSTKGFGESSPSLFEGAGRNSRGGSDAGFNFGQGGRAGGGGQGEGPSGGFSFDLFGPQGGGRGQGGNSAGHSASPATGGNDRSQEIFQSVQGILKGKDSGEAVVDEAIGEVESYIEDIRSAAETVQAWQKGGPVTAEDFEMIAELVGPSLKSLKFKKDQIALLQEGEDTNLSSAQKKKCGSILKKLVNLEKDADKKLTQLENLAGSSEAAE